MNSVEGLGRLGALETHRTLAGGFAVAWMGRSTSPQPRFHVPTVLPAPWPTVRPAMSIAPSPRRWSRRAKRACFPCPPRWTGTQRLTDTYRYFHHLPLRDSADALYVDWCELTTTDAAGRVLYRNSWATSHRVTAETVVAIAAVGRGRCKIENENNNTLQTKGYHFEHNYGHGKQHLSAVLATLIILAYLVHTVLDCLDQRYRAVRALLPSRRDNLSARGSRL